GGGVPASLLHLRGELETAFDSRPATLGAASQWLDRIAPAIGRVASHVAAHPAADAVFWCDALVRQCAMLQAEMRALIDMAGDAGMPTLRELGASGLPRMSQVERLAGVCDELSRLECGFLYDRS